jgi:hypothetical protein
VLTFGVWRPSVSARLALRFHLRPLHLAVWTLASSARPPSEQLPIPRCFHPWSCVHPRGPRLLPCPLIRHGPRTVPSSRASSPEVRLPFNAPNLENPLPGSRLPARPLRDVPSCGHLVASFHARFGPPSPFLTTLTVCASPSPVVCFDHSRSGGLRSLAPRANEFMRGMDCDTSASRPSSRSVRFDLVDLAVFRAVSPFPSARCSVGSSGPEDPCVPPVQLRLPPCEGMLPLRRRPRCSR